MTKVVAHVPDLMDRSKVRAAFPDAVLVNRAADLAAAAADADLVLVDLSRPGVLAGLSGLSGLSRPSGPSGPSQRSGPSGLQGPPRRVIGFASHVDEATLTEARNAGVEALARSVFFRRLPTLAHPGD